MQKMRYRYIIFKNHSYMQVCQRTRSFKKSKGIRFRSGIQKNVYQYCFKKMYYIILHINKPRKLIARKGNYHCKKRKLS